MGAPRMALSYPADTLPDLLAGADPQRPAIGAPGRPWLSHGGLRQLSAATLAALNGFGIGRGDRVAIVLPNGPEMAAAFIAIAGAATTAPLNPAYKADEFDFYLADLNARALVIQQGMDSPARAVAAARGIPVITLVAGEAAGSFSLHPDAPMAGTPQHPGAAQADDVALVLHTSGTTSRPKIVPLRHVNVTASAVHIGAALRLAPDDCCLNIMPLFHIHGLMAAVLASLAAGASVCCTPGFNAFRFFAWFAEARPSWFTAVPTMHQALLQYAERNKAVIAAGRLRLLRSSSASLPPQVMAALEAAFGVPVIESYGMTEASHQMASNPLPPAERHAGSVGRAAGPELAIMAADGTLLAAGARGEVVIRGRNVTAGYEANPEANARAFTDGWFRTGDEGWLDAAGYLRLSGRLKEIINRGGEKISGREIEDLLVRHPGIVEAAVVPAAHPRLGEQPAAFIMTKGDPPSEQELADFLRSEGLAPQKIPRMWRRVDDLPRTASGKVKKYVLQEELAARD